MKFYIVVKLQFEAIHKWESCPYDDVSFLRNSHRHIFYVCAKKEIFHNDRDIEFIRFKREIDEYINVNFRGKDLDNMSCEMIAESIIEKFGADFVSVFEDDENGVEVWR